MNRKTQTKKTTVFYTGLSPKTLTVLSKEFHISGVAFLDFLLNKKTSNPINFLLKLVYRLRILDKYYFLEFFSSCLLRFLRVFLTSFYQRYVDYVLLISKNKFKVIDIDNETNLENYLMKHPTDLMVVNAWSILSEKVVNLPKWGTLNIHPSILPKYRGALPTLWALKNKDSKTGVTFMLLDKKIDTGPIIAQIEFSIDNLDTAIDLERKIDSILETYLNEKIISYVGGNLIGQQQESSAASTTAKYLEYRKINFSHETMKEITNKVALYPYIEPGVFCYFYFYNKREVFLKRCYTVSVLSAKKGDFIIRDGIWIYCKCKDGWIKFRLFIDVTWEDSFFFLKEYKKYSKNQYDLSRYYSA